MKRNHKLLLATVVLLVATCLFAYWATHRGFYVVLENQSSGTVADLRLEYEDGSIDLGTLSPGKTVRARFRPRPGDAQGGEFTMLGRLRRVSPVQEDRRIGVGLFVTRGRSLNLRLVEVTRPDGKVYLRIEGEGWESFDPYRYAVRAWNGDMPGRVQFPAISLESED